MPAARRTIHVARSVPEALALVEACEIPILNVGAAIASAVARAIGKPVHELPLTPPRVLDVLINNPAPLTLPHIPI